MGALTKLSSHIRKHTAIFFSATLPQALRFSILTLHMLWISYKRARVKYKFAALINKQSSKFIYRRKSKNVPDDDDDHHHITINCSICLSDFTEGEEGRELKICKHFFHKKCIEKWLLLEGTCPLCRNVVAQKEIVAEHCRVVMGNEEEEVEMELALLFLSAVHGRIT